MLVLSNQLSTSGGGGGADIGGGGGVFRYFGFVSKQYIIVMLCNILPAW